MVTITRDSVEKGYWRQRGYPVCLAVDNLLHDYACAAGVWNSDRFRPQDRENEAQLGIHVESPCPETGITTEKGYWLPLDRRAENSLKKLRNEGIQTLKECRFRVLLPMAALIHSENAGSQTHQQEENALHDSNYDHYFQTAERTWRKRLLPDNFTVAVTGADDQGGEQTLQVHVCHHESFPSGGQTFTADLREPRPAGQTATHGSLLERRRFYYHPAAAQ